MINKLYQYIDNVLANGIGKDIWFMTKQTMSDFYMPFFIAEIVETYNEKKHSDESFGAYYSRYFRENPYMLSKYPKQCESENTYRNAIISEFFGLFYRTKSGYDSGVTTPAYNVLKKHIKDHNDIKKYRFLVDRQIEKLCLNVNSSTRIYSEVEGVTIFPVIYLYKILLELNKKYGESKLDFNEFLLFLVRSKTYDEWVNTLELIDIYRTETINDEYKQKINTIIHDVSMTNIRFDALFGTLQHIDYSSLRFGNYYQIKQNDNSLRYVQNVIDIFEHSDYVNCTDKNTLLNFMQSDKYFIGNLDVFSVIHDDKEDNEMQDDIINLIIETYNNHNFDFNIEQDKYNSFKNLYGKDAILSLEGKDLLYRLFAPKKLSSEGLTYILEFNNSFREFGGIGGGSAYKFPLFYSNQHNSWVSGKSNKSIRILNEESAIELATSIRDELVELFELVENTNLLTVEDYKNFEILTYSDKLLPRMWVLKYLHLLYPDKFSCFYSDLWLNFMLEKIGIKEEGGVVTKNGQISMLAAELEIPNVFLFKVLYELFPMTNDDYVEEENEVKDQIDYDNVERITGGTNIILYGVPGAGKSYTIDKEYTDDITIKERVVFHPDYTYSDFVGQILPKSQDGNVSYTFVPGPFTKIMREARRNPNKKFILVIEEINRGNAPAIFGDIFQLLDRRSTHELLNGYDRYGESIYGIVNADIANIVYEDITHEVKIPSNLSIICTMNTSDQNVFTLDTAFQRRWNMRLIENSFNKETEEERIFAEHHILDTSVTWEHFCETINELILEKNQNMTSSEDKRLGTHFVNLEDLNYDANELNEDATNDQRKEARLSNRRFPEKVIKYLWDDAFKFYRDEVFKGEFSSLEKVIKEFTTKTKDDRFGIFKDTIKADILKSNN